MRKLEVKLFYWHFLYTILRKSTWHNFKTLPHNKASFFLKQFSIHSKLPNQIQKKIIKIFVQIFGMKNTAGVSFWGQNRRCGFSWSSCLGSWNLRQDLQIQNNHLYTRDKNISIHSISLHFTSLQQTTFKHLTIKPTSSEGSDNLSSKTGKILFMCLKN